MEECKGVMIFGEITEGKLASITTELLGCGRKLANDLGEEVFCLLIGNEVGNLANEAIFFGADKVYVVQDSLFKDYLADSYLLAVEEIARNVSSLILLFGQTNIGRDLAPRLAFRLGVALSMDCLELNIDPETKALLQTRPVYGGNAQAIFTSDFLPQMVTVRQRAMLPLGRDESRRGEVIPVKIEIDPAKIRIKLIEKVAEEATGIKLENASVIICGGRGIGGPEGFKKLEELAKLLKGAVGATRPPCDNGWVPATSQIGLTGKIVAPDLYIAFGVSGASQHLAGCSGAKNIVAVNKDPEANIFREARFGVVGNWKEVLPALIEKLKELTKDA